MFAYLYLSLPNCFLKYHKCTPVLGNKSVCYFSCYVNCTSIHQPSTLNTIGNNATDYTWLNTE